MIRLQMDSLHSGSGENFGTDSPPSRSTSTNGDPGGKCDSGPVAALLCAVVEGLRSTKNAKLYRRSGP